mmetsp:Transcript_5828/g.12854  ORF Transcript_5828/g.12854 Transcript_5828/m.12854 type:complete len:244 (-) Transcript_5828:19-750(-)
MIPREQTETVDLCLDHVLRRWQSDPPAETPITGNAQGHTLTYQSHFDRGQVRFIWQGPKHAITQDMSCFLPLWNHWAALAVDCFRLLAPESAKWLEPDSLEPEVSSVSVLDLFYYQTGEPGGVDLGGHTDPGVLTIVAGSTPGLEILHHGAWHPVPATSETPVILSGRMLGNITSGRLLPCTHRVVRAREATVPRASATFELRLSEAGVFEAARLEGQQRAEGVPDRPVFPADFGEAWRCRIA